MFFLNFYIIKKIKTFGKITFLLLSNNNKKINIFIKNLNFKFKPSIIGVYGCRILNFFIIFEICYFKFKINKIKKFYKFKSFFFFFLRNFFINLNFYEMDIPLIENYSNSGSKQFIVLNKNEKNEFFSLSQSPQYIKQYYMFNNVKKYFKIANCFRDEDEKSSRIKEFQQLDIELSFSNFVIIKNIINIFLKYIIYYFLKKYIFKYIIKYKYIKKFFFEKKNFKRPYLYKKLIIKKFNIYIFKSIKIKINFKRKYFNFKKYFIIITLNNNIFFLCYLFDFFLKYYNIINLKFIFFWYINFNYFKNKKFNHHQFSAYKNNFLNLKKSKSLSYDLYLNGIEIGGGSIRNLDLKIQKKNFFFLKNKKSFFLNFLKRSVPQHCGIALGIERILSLICNIKIKDTITYYKYKKKIKSLKINNKY